MAKFDTPITDSIFQKLNDDELLLINELYKSKQDEIERLNNKIEKAIEYIKTKKAIINTDYIRIFDLFEIDEQVILTNY